MLALARISWVFDCGTVAGRVVMPLLERGVLEGILERTASFGYISLVRPSSSREIRREGGSRPRAITLESIPVVGSRCKSVSLWKAPPSEVRRIA